jgi:hypothetical protein
MKKNTNLILLALLFILGGWAYWSYSNKGLTSLNGKDWEFAVQDTASINRIFLASPKGETVTLERNGLDWQVNGKYKARPDAIKTLMQTLKNVEIAYRLPRAAVQTAVKDLVANRLKVELYHNKEKLKSYYVGGVNQDETATYMIMENSNEPYAMSLAHWEGGLRVRYITSEMDWRDRSVFSDAVEDIQSVSVDYSVQKGKSFSLTRQGKSFKVEPLSSITPRINSPVNNGLVESYLLGFRSQIAEGFENTNAKKDSILRTVPFATINLVNTAGVKKTAVLYPILATNPDGTPRVSGNGEFTYERYFAATGTGDFMMVQQLNYMKLLWPYEEFFQTSQPNMRN